MKTGLLAITLMCSCYANGQSVALDHFDKIMVSHRINLYLVEGEDENLRFEFENIDPDKIRYEVTNKRLKIYLEGAKLTEPQERIDNYRKSIFSGGQVHAYVTYKNLIKLVIRGEQTIACNTPIDVSKFTLRIYGEAKVDLAGLQTDYFKAALYGENRLAIAEGDIDTQRFSLYGENKIKVKDVTCHDTRTTSFGENDLVINSKNLSLTAFGEADIAYAGPLHIKRKFVLGESAIRSLPK